jgi:hypothetical protein
MGPGPAHHPCRKRKGEERRGVERRGVERRGEKRGGVEIARNKKQDVKEQVSRLLSTGRYQILNNYQMSAIHFQKVFYSESSQQDVREYSLQCYEDSPRPNKVHSCLYH